MTRPKVPEERRQRTAQACDTCKRRKQKHHGRVITRVFSSVEAPLVQSYMDLAVVMAQYPRIYPQEKSVTKPRPNCNGLKPCSTCVKRSSICQYTPSPSHDGDTTSRAGSVTKRRNTDEPFDLLTLGPSTQPSRSNSSISTPRHAWSSPMVGYSHYVGTEQAIPNQLFHGQDNPPLPSTLASLNKGTVVLGQDDHIDVYGDVRMLEDSNGRLLFVGNSSTLSYLQFMRIIVDRPTEHSSFTSDPIRHKIPENHMTMPSDIESPWILPGREAVDALIQFFFTNTRGLVELMERRHLEMTVNAYYMNPASVHPSDLCNIYLTLAASLVMVVPTPGTEADYLLGPFSIGSIEQAEALLKSAMYFGEQLPEFTDGDIWSIQAHALIAMYKFSVSKWNAAYASIAKAVSFAIALGLHRIDDYIGIFQNQEIALAHRRNLWKSLFVLDKLISEFLGRPSAISEENCSPSALIQPKVQDEHNANETTHMESFNATVKSCQGMGMILREIYGRSRRVPIQVGKELFDECLHRVKAFSPRLSASRVFKEMLLPDEGIAVLYTNLVELHCQLLLTRPYFLFLLFQTQREASKTPETTVRASSDLGMLSESCLAVAKRTLHLMHAAYMSSWLPRRNTFIFNFLLAAGLVVHSNESFGLYRNEQYSELARQATEMSHYCAGSDALGKRVSEVLNSFHRFVQKQKASESSSSRPRIQSQGLKIPSFPDTNLPELEVARGLIPGLKRPGSAAQHRETLGRPDDTTVPSQRGGTHLDPRGGMITTFEQPKLEAGASSLSRADVLATDQPWNIAPLPSNSGPGHPTLAKSRSMATLPSHGPPYRPPESYAKLPDRSGLHDERDRSGSFTMKDEE
ncbi:unnamed protein product [Clonostachys solani]|uniref:Xylanolytic transcriptional activator regulatory domain-containing protein n=1 Tax=Clonostachys solani TaxID=160281 RepID=A0A9P0EHM9_9HYPO|nr:unnamed protein product [Clonostachys solani]